MSAASPNAGTGADTGAAVEAKAAAQAGLDEQGERVRGIFSKIARRYELFNALSSLGIYRHWLNVVARHAACSPTDRVLDVAGGAGDVAFTLARRCPPASIELTDFCREMLDVAQTRIEAGEGRGVPVRTSIADAMDLPYDDASFDVLTVAYGLRNFSDRVRSMREALRVLRPGGTYVALEFSTPGNPAWRALYDFYLGHVIPLVGGALTHDRPGFDYLVSSIREFPPQHVIVGELESVGFADVGYHGCTGGVATVYWATRPCAQPAAHPAG